uniref:Uncharacterized protein n=1 Tax=Anguilla anguilla TaxID=7936 RepID=A0A0E9WRH8_ANGAN
MIITVFRGDCFLGGKSQSPPPECTVCANENTMCIEALAGIVILGCFFVCLCVLEGIVRSSDYCWHIR